MSKVYIQLDFYLIVLVLLVLILVTCVSSMVTYIKVTKRHLDILEGIDNEYGYLNEKEEEFISFASKPAPPLFRYLGSRKENDMWIKVKDKNGFEYLLNINNISLIDGNGSVVVLNGVTYDENSVLHLAKESIDKLVAAVNKQLVHPLDNYEDSR